MEAVNAVGLTPLSVLSKTTKPRKSLAFPTIIPQFKNQSCSVTRTLQSGIAILSSVLTSGFSRALSYEEALQQSVSTSTSSDIDISGAIDSLINVASENPLIVGGGVAVLAVPLVVSQLISKPSKPWGVESARNAYAKLSGEDGAQLLDIRPQSEIKQSGSVDLKGLKKKPVSIVYKGEDKPGFLNKLGLRFKEPENTTLFVLDKFDGNSEIVAELVTANGFKAAYAIKDGAEGPRGWKNSGLPWSVPKKGFSFDLSSLTEAFGDGADAFPLTLGVAAAAGLGLLAFTEAETLLQVLGSAAIIQFVSKKLLFAEDRKQTLQQIEEVLNTKVAPNEIVGDIQQIGKALLPLSTSKALPAPTETSPVATEETVPKPESVPETETAPPKVEAAQEPTPAVNSVPKAEIEEKPLPEVSTPLSPYSNYPDYKPPSSPIPSQP